MPKYPFEKSKIVIWKILHREAKTDHIFGIPSATHITVSTKMW